MTFLFLELGRHQDVFERLKGIVRAHFPDIESITFESIQQCEYLRWCLNETLGMTHRFHLIQEQLLKTQSCRKVVVKITNPQYLLEKELKLSTHYGQHIEWRNTLGKILILSTPQMEQLAC